MLNRILKTAHNWQGFGSETKKDGLIRLSGGFHIQQSRTQAILIHYPYDIQ
jgi:hypothetical protein